jgi:Mitochondrial carrier protein
MSFCSPLSFYLFHRNVPGVAFYFVTLTRLRHLLYTFFPSLAVPTAGTRPKLNPVGDLLAGATARTWVGFVLMPVTVLKTRAEVRDRNGHVHLCPFLSRSFSAPFPPCSSPPSPFGSGNRQRPQAVIPLPTQALSQLQTSPEHLGHPWFLQRCSANRTSRRTLCRSLCRLLRTSQTHPRKAALGITPRCQRRDCRSSPALLLSFPFLNGNSIGYVPPPPPPQQKNKQTPGGLGAVLATLVTAPFDTLKTKQQVFPDRYKSIAQSARLMFRTTGLRGFFDGVSLRVARKGASSAIAWSLYEGLLRRWTP